MKGVTVVCIIILWYLMAGHILSTYTRTSPAVREIYRRPSYQVSNTITTDNY